MNDIQERNVRPVGALFPAAAAFSLLIFSGLPLAALASADGTGTCSSSFSDYQVDIFSATSSLSQDPQVTVYPSSASNQYNYKVLGGGAAVHVMTGSVFLKASYPDIDPGATEPVGWVAEAKHLGSGALARVTAYVIAVNDPNNCWDVQAFSNTTTSAVAHSAASVAVGAGYVLTGGGAQPIPAIPGGNGSFLFLSMPTNVAGGTNNGWSVQSKDHGVSDHANITAYAIGIKPAVAGVTTPTVNVIPSAPSAAANYPAAQATGFNSIHAGLNCTLTGGGANDNWGNGYGNMLTAIYPAGNTGWQALGGYYGQANAATLTAYLVCLN
jgi:hypothetical protein